MAVRGAAVVLAVLLVAALQAEPAAALGSRTGILPPANPSINIVANPDIFQVCSGSGYDDSSGCVDGATQAITNARAQEGVAPIVLPTNWTSLTPQQQLFVAINLERTARGLTPMEGMATLLDEASAQAAAASTDPNPPAGFSPPACPSGNCSGTVWQSESAWDLGSPLAALYGWMYEDGLWPGGSVPASQFYNVACVGSTDAGCWGHRDGILESFGGFGCNPCVMGTGFAATSSSGGPAWAALLATTSGSPALDFSWQQELSYLPASEGGSSPPAPKCNSNDHAVRAENSRTAGAAGLGFTALASPVRIADTRQGAGDPSTYAGDTLCPGGELTVDIPSSDVPSDAGAVVAQLTAVSPSASGFLSAFPAGTSWPGTANVNFTTSQTVGNLTTVGLGTDPATGSPAITVYDGAGTGAVTDFTLDLYGYYAPQSAGSGDPYVPLTPQRIFDTRPGSSYPGAGQTLRGASSVDVPVAGVGSVPTDASAVVVNIALTNTTSPSYIEGYPTGSPPSSSTPTVNQNWVGGETLSVTALIGVGQGGSITLANQAGDVDLVIDVDGYFGPPGSTGDLFSALSTPVRILDSRPGGLAAGNSATAPIAGVGGAAADVTAAVLNVADIASAPNYLTVYPAGQSVPLASDVNYELGDVNTILDNAAYGTVGSGGAVGIYDGSNSDADANVVVDMFGYFSS